MLKETKNLEMVTLGNEAFNSHVKGIQFHKKLMDIKHVHEEIKAIGGKGLKVTLTLSDKAMNYVEKCNAYGLCAKSEGITELELSLPENIKAVEIDEKVAILNKVFYETKAEKAKAIYDLN